MFFPMNFANSFKSTYFVEYRLIIAYESVRYHMYIFLSEVHLEEKEEYKHYLRITLRCFDKLFLLMKDDITK